MTSFAANELRGRPLRAAPLPPGFIAGKDGRAPLAGSAAGRRGDQRRRSRRAGAPSSRARGGRGPARARRRRRGPRGRRGGSGRCARAGARAVARSMPSIAIAWRDARLRGPSSRTCSTRGSSRSSTAAPRPRITPPPAAAKRAQLALELAPAGVVGQQVLGGQARRACPRTTAIEASRESRPPPAGASSQRRASASLGARAPPGGRGTARRAARRARARPGCRRRRRARDRDQRHRARHRRAGRRRWRATSARQRHTVMTAAIGTALSGPARADQRRDERRRPGTG